MPKKTISKDQILERRAGSLRGDTLLKALREPTTWNEEKRSATFVMSTEQVDRYGDIVRQEGLDITNFNKNPIMLLFHNSRTWPAGTWSNIEKDLTGRPKKTLGVANFMPEGTDENCDKAAKLVAMGVIKCCSIGFQPDWEAAEPIFDDEDSWTGGIDFRMSELIECSIVPVPANPGAMAKAAAEMGELSLCRDFISEILDSYEKSPAGLIVPRKALEEAHHEASGNKVSVSIPANLKTDPELSQKIKESVQKEVEEAKKPKTETIGSLKVELELDTSEFDASLKAATTALEEFSQKDEGLFARFMSLFKAKSAPAEVKPEIIEGSGVKAAEIFASIRAKRASA